MTREEAKQTFTIHTNGSDKFIKVDKRTFDKFYELYCRRYKKGYPNDNPST